ncbi:recombinase family protein [Hymenobacter sp. BT664]|uniref:Recombinase family protein n=1 Tax=Hymenobacter montanus TaxID=2771359 RepID=A0A927BH43_9BACT|nr:recombinase family protein [Hymenobacter montanus]MBD2769798.1 recombinase family protein [Hymenobacter montanus]
MHLGYARGSAKDQHLDTQLKQLKASGVDRLHQEKISGTTTPQPVLTELLANVRAGDAVTVAHLSWLGRSSAHIMQMGADLSAHQMRSVALDTWSTCRHITLLWDEFFNKGQ